MRSVRQSKRPLPVVGVVPLWDDRLDSLWMLPGYFDGVIEAGGTPVMLPLTDDGERVEQLADMCDAILFTGGHDVDPALYGETPGPHTTELCPARDRMETLLLHATLERDKPVLGICRGIQFLNAALGGTLWQDLPSERSCEIEHHGKPPYDRPVHTVRVVPESPLASVLWKERDSERQQDGQNQCGPFDEFHPAPYTLAVNSYHHQGIDRLAPSLVAMAHAPDGLVEAVYMPGKRFVWAVQWHPEFSHRVDANARAIFSAFVASC
ncbi:amidotransferase [Bifidobacterium lemurum]|uniref:Amidotransferase n=1 Tax=Bifidobacterium lemurum TaxID=1603886 RepID=A0A261FSZ0_9BIFI|nr:amidotransferase [Bifidobacterium lemurum]